MRFMMLLKANADSEAGLLPSTELIEAMGRYNDAMMKAGVLLDAAGLQASSRGARVRFAGTRRTVIDGPFAEAKELLAGFWLIQVKSKEEAIEWAKRCPHQPDYEDLEIELRRVFEPTDFPNASPEIIEQEQKFRSAAPRE